jgi:hypothetical protein
MVRTPNEGCGVNRIRFIRQFPFTRKIPHTIRLFRTIGIFPLKTTMRVENVGTIYISLDKM